MYSVPYSSGGVEIRVGVDRQAGPCLGQCMGALVDDVVGGGGVVNDVLHYLDVGGGGGGGWIGGLAPGHWGSPGVVMDDGEVIPNFFKAIPFRDSYPFLLSLSSNNK